MPIRVLIADDHIVVRSGLAHLLREEELEVVGEAADGREAIRLAAEAQPDVILMDVRMPDMDGLEALEAIIERAPTARVVMFSTYDNPTYVARAIALGAVEYITKGDSGNAVVSTIRRVAEGRPNENGSIMKTVATSLKKRPLATQEEPNLTRREHQVLRHLAFGLSNREIGRSLNISIETVKEHVQNVLRKLGVGDRTEAAVWAVRKRMV